MEVINKPKWALLDRGHSFKTIQVKGLAGMVMPKHHSTKEAVIVVQKGQALLKMPNTDHLLQKSASFIIPAGIKHSLNILKDFEAIAIMEVDSEICFK